jgi:hypothetical protein
MPGIDPLTDLSATNLAQLAEMARSAKRPPVESWTPPHCGDSHIRIARDGSWWHEERQIRRPELVRLFANILRREPDGRFVLVTPAEMLDVEVEEAPFVAVELRSEGEGRERMLAFRLNTGEPVIAGPDHPIRVRQRDDEPLPTLLVRDGLEALIARPVYYELATMAIDEAGAPPGLWSNRAFFALEGAE